MLGHFCGSTDWNNWSKCGFQKTRHCGRFLVCFTLLYTLFPPYNTCLFAAVVLISLVLWDLVVEKVAESIREREDNIMLPTFKLFSTELDTDKLTTLVWIHMFGTPKHIQRERMKIIFSKYIYRKKKFRLSYHTLKESKIKFPFLDILENFWKDGVHEYYS